MLIKQIQDSKSTVYDITFAYECKNAVNDDLGQDINTTYLHKDNGERISLELLDAIYPIGSVVMFGNLSENFVHPNRNFALDTLSFNIYDTNPNNWNSEANWVRLNDVFIYSSDSNIGFTGGRKDRFLPFHTHPTGAPSPATTGAPSASHYHQMPRNWSGGSAGTSDSRYTKTSNRTLLERFTNTDGAHQHTMTHNHPESTGASVASTGIPVTTMDANNDYNMPPYIKVAMWKRVANKPTGTTSHTTIQAKTHEQLSSYTHKQIGMLSSQGG